MSILSRGILYMFAASFSFSIMNAFAKALSQHIPAMENVFFRSVVMVFIMLLVYVRHFFKHTKKKQLQKGGWGKLLARVVFGSFAMFCVFFNIMTIPLGTAIAFAQSVPIYAVLFGALLLKEKVSLPIILATGIGFVGILLIGNPNFSNIGVLNIVFGILSGVCMAIAFVTLRNLKLYFDNSFVILSFAIGTTLLGFFGMFLPIDRVGGFVMPTCLEWWLIAGMGISGTIAQYFLNQAYVSAPVSIVSPIDYSRILFSVILGILLGDPLPNFATTFGISLIIISGLLIATPSLLKDLKKLRKRKVNI